MHVIELAGGPQTTEVTETNSLADKLVDTAQSSVESAAEATAQTPDLSHLVGVEDYVSQLEPNFLPWILGGLIIFIIAMYMRRTK